MSYRVVVVWKCDWCAVTVTKSKKGDLPRGWRAHCTIHGKRHSCPKCRSTAEAVSIL